jgi:pSer/pThr/pTyr-binding forkhead associated (FHA) protein
MPWLALGTTVRELPEGETVVGSGADADWRVSSTDLNPRHFVVRVSAGTMVVIDPGAHDNVVAMNGRQLVAPTQLQDGSTIFAGSGVFAFTLNPPGARVESEPSEPGFLVNDADRVAYTLSSRSTTIGRDASNVIVLRDPTASRFHAEVRREAGGFALRSIGAMGAVLNGVDMERPTLLEEGDVAEIAFAELRFTHSAPSGGVRLASAETIRADESSRRPTLEPGERVVVDESSPAGRHTRRVQILVGLGVVLAAVLWWAFP